jgi:hypothetical protein
MKDYTKMVGPWQTHLKDHPDSHYYGFRLSLDGDIHSANNIWIYSVPYDFDYPNKVYYSDKTRDNKLHTIDQAKEATDHWLVKNGYKLLTQDQYDKYSMLI